MTIKLLGFLSANAKRGAFRAEGNTLFIYDVIVSNDLDAEWFGGVSPKAFVDALSALSGDVALRINCPGGDVFAAVAIAQAMREYPGAITVHVDGYAASAASVIAVAGDKVVMAPGSFMMIHKAWTIAGGNSDDFLGTADLLDKVDGSIAEAYAAKAGGDAARFAPMMTAETWFTAAEAVAAGLADEVAPDKPKALGAWDLSAFASAPKVEPEQASPPPSEPADNSAHRRRLHAVRMLAPTA